MRHVLFVSIKKYGILEYNLDAQPQLANRSIRDLGDVNKLCAYGERLYCACGMDGSIAVVDMQSMRLIYTAWAGPNASDIAISGNGKNIFVLCADSDSISMLEAENGMLARIATIGTRPVSLTLDNSGFNLLAACSGTGSVYWMGAKTMRLRRELTVPGTPVYAALVDGGIYCAAVNDDYLSGCAYIFDMRGRIQTKFDLPGAPMRMLPLSGGMAACAFAGGIAMLDMRTADIKWIYDFDGIPESLAVHENRLYAADMLNHTLLSVDLYTAAFINKLELPGQPGGLLVAYK